MLVVLGLGDANGLIEVIVGQCWIDDLVAVLFEVGRLFATRHRGPAVKKQDAHVLARFRLRAICFIS